MKLNDIVTPQEDPVAYQPDWRHCLAVASQDSRLPPCYAADPELRAYWLHLRRRARSPLEPGVRPEPQDRIAGWKTGQTGRLLEAYLVTQASYAEIAHDLGLDTADVQQYGALYWDVRNAEGRPRPGVLACLRARQENGLLRIALLGGTQGLRNSLGTGQEQEMEEMVNHEIMMRIREGGMNTRDLARLQSNALMRRRIELEGQNQNEPLRESLEFMQHLMSAFAPRMKPVEQTPEAILAADLAIRARLDSQRLATGIGITRDAGGEKRLDALVKSM
jgi:hypothetical protein